jgi:hypothetical protein
MLALGGIVGAVVFATLASAQGYLGGTQYPPCNAAIGQGWQYYGCWNFQPSAGVSQYYNLSISSNVVDSYQGYPGWAPTKAPFWYTYVSDTPFNCTQACRGHGYRFAALVSGFQCQCGQNPPTTPAPSSSLDPKGVSGNSCHANTVGSALGAFCPGDATQFCGLLGSGNIPYADVYVDNSFPLFSSINPTVEQNNYRYMGCFLNGAPPNNVNSILAYRPPNFGANATSGFTTQAQCFYACANLGFPMVDFDGGNSYGSLVNLVLDKIPKLILLQVLLWYRDSRWNPNFGFKLFGKL